jgi:multidrug resistance efflux pump
MIQLASDVKLADGPRGSGLCYWPKDGKSLELSSSLYPVAKILRSTSYLSIKELASQTGQNELEVSANVDALIDLSILQKVNLNGPNSVDERHRGGINIKRVEPYKYYLGEITSVKPLKYAFEFANWSALGRSVFPIMLVLGGWQIYGFYFSPGRSFGAEIKSDLFFSPSIYEAFIVFTVTNLLTILYKIAIGTGKSYGSGSLYVKLLAGFNPVFDTKEDSVYQSSNLKVSKYEYLYYIGSPVVARFYLLMICIFLVNFAYPYLTASNRFALSILMTTINISWMALLWQLIPSPGTLSIKILELYRVIPSNLLGLSLRVTLQDLLSSKAENRTCLGLKRYKLFLLISLTLLVFKSLFLFLWVLPQVSAGVPTFLGDWTRQFVVLFLAILTVRFMLYSYLPRRHQGVVQDAGTNLETTIRKPNAPNIKSNTLFDSDVIGRIRPFFTKKLTVLICIIFVFPFGSSVAGSAIVEENMSLGINSSELESSYVSKVLKVGPSTVTVRKDEPILVLNSEGLRLAVTLSSESIAGLKAERQILEVQQKSLEKGGSKYETGLNKSEDVLINASDLESKRQELRSLQRQYDIAKSQLTRFKILLASGAVSELQYEDKKIDLEEVLVKKVDAQNKLTASISSLVKAQRNESVEQAIKLDEDRKSVANELKKVDASLAQEQSNLRSLEQRIRLLTLRAPFDCVIETDTSLLEGKNIAFGDAILSVKAVPTERVIVKIPEYSRTEVMVGDRVEVRLYSRVFSRVSGHLSGRVIQISPISTIEEDQEQLHVTVNVDESLHDSMIGATGTAKIRTGYTCLLLNLLKPLARFAEVDLWQYLP